MTSLEAQLPIRWLPNWVG